ncbi:putative nucleotide-diphospho-sugar transferase [Mesorhizobium marinum]|uniref:putative nucleotide-diphospho-sugar transferase n=1 Tax=Mesorhizobium marinum TaxID=3228790 RepID=UPI003466CFD1
MKKGVVYIAFGDRYVKEVLFSAATLKAVSDVHVTLFTDSEISSSNIDSIIKIDPVHKRPKVDHLPRTPYDLTLYLDSDTKIERDVADMFSLLDRFDLAAAHDHCRKSSRWSSVIPEYDAIPYCFPEYNSGVMLFRKSAKLDHFFRLWQDNFYRYRETTNGQDQASFRIALWESELQVHTLPFEYNVRNLYFRKKMAARSKMPADEGLLKPRILHWHGLNRNKLFDSFNSKYRAMPY